MKELSLYRLRERALDKGLIVLTAQQLANISGKSKAIATTYLSRMARMGLGKRVGKGKIALEQDEYIISNRLVEPSYISLHSALLIHTLIQQVPRNVMCVTTRKSISYPDVGIEYHKIPPGLFYGYERHRAGNAHMLLAEPEKALLDGLYLNMFDDATLKELAPRLNADRFRQLAFRFRGRGQKKLRRLARTCLKRKH